MLGQTEINTFWNDVEQQLRRRRSLTSEQAVRAILRYRNALASADVTNMVYHREPSEVADDIVAGEYDTEP